MYITKQCKSNKFCGKDRYKSPECQNKQIFDAKKNDIWCVGVSLYMMLTGTAPFYQARPSDPCYSLIMNGFMKNILRKWDLCKFVDDNCIHLLRHILQKENKRYSLAQIKNHPWMKK